jgi:hypothetical protein
MVASENSIVLSAGETVMSKAMEYRAMAAEEHRLAGMCRSPFSREQHLLRETQLLELAHSEECFQSEDTMPQHHPASPRAG